MASTFFATMTQEFLSSVLVGHNLNEGISGPVESIKKRYFARGKKTIIAAIMDAYSNYEVYLAEKYKL